MGLRRFEGVDDMNFDKTKTRVGNVETHSPNKLKMTEFNNST
jgi:hypothetical protein